MRFKTTVSIAVAALIFTSCNQSTKRVLITNKLPFERREVVSIALSEIGNDAATHQWKTLDEDSVLANQLLDTNSDSIPDELLVYVSVAANGQKEIELTPLHEVKNPSPTVTYSRFVPERTDDYAWENDLVAFRTYGPVAQQLVEEGKQGGTLSSGLDCWLKRVNYPIIDKWYKKYTDGGTYHKDDGEGYDPYHVGKSRGCGGIGVWKNDSLYISKNFISYKKVIDGPIRNVFELTYAPWSADGSIIRETKRITIDAGNQLYRIDDLLSSEGVLPDITIGITLHDKKGSVSTDSLHGIFSYWEPIDDSELGTAVVVNSENLVSFRDFRTTKKDLSHLYITVKPRETVSYHTGFAWKKAGIVTDANSWNTYLSQFSQRLKSPLTVQIKE
jgi:hypothetical protein